MSDSSSSPKEIPLPHSGNDTRMPHGHVHIRTQPLLDGSGFMFSLVDDFMFPSRAVLFHVLRDALSAHEGGRFLSVKYAALVLEVQLPVIHDPVELVFYTDTLITFRDPVEAINAKRELMLSRVPSQPYYFRKKSPHDVKSPHAQRPSRGPGQVVLVNTAPPEDEPG
jgi:hypothetical protein